MKICFMGPAHSPHIAKWCRWFVNRGHEIDVISFVNYQIENVNVHYVSNEIKEQGNDFQKIKYLSYSKKVKKLVDQIKPEVISVHIATSYGTVAALAGLKNYTLSVWGNDIYGFPRKSFFHKALLKYSLKNAKYLFSTSKAMAEEAALYTNKEFQITPFGVDMNLFNSDKRTRKDDRDFIIGTIKTLSPRYGIDYLLNGVKYVKEKRPDIPIKVRIAGKGPSEDEYKRLAVDLGISDITTWLGFISQEEAAKEWANMDVAVISSSSSESFGVSAVEAEASGIPVIITDVPGLKESTKPDYTSIVVPICDEKAIGESLITLYDNPNKRVEFGNNGRRFVFSNYEINKCFANIEKLLKNTIK